LINDWIVCKLDFDESDLNILDYPFIKIIFLPKIQISLSGKFV
jgi:hypothetical protein